MIACALANFQEIHEELLRTFSALPWGSPQKTQAFQSLIRHHHSKNRRSLAWRDHITPYRVMVSEIMLQQTQVHRVAPKFEQFIARFPDFAALAEAPFCDVLLHWKGLGYNRRALALHKIAHIVIANHEGSLPGDPKILESLPGIGKASARSIAAFAFNSPTVFIETNIRTVFIYLYYKDRLDVHDKELEPLVSQTLDRLNPREWYYALMDYGVMLKKTVGNFSRLSSHYHKQSQFAGSDRQIRGMILQTLLDTPGIAKNSLAECLNKESQRVDKILSDLCAEGLVKEISGALMLP